MRQIRHSSEMQCFNRQNHKAISHLTVESKLIFLLLLEKKNLVVLMNRHWKNVGETCTFSSIHFCFQR